MTSKPSEANDALLSGNIRSENHDSDLLENSDDTPVSDKFNLIYWISCILGCGILIAYNFLVSAPDYFADEYPDHDNINTLMVPVYSIPNILFLIIVVLYGHLFSFTSRIVICFLLMGISLFFPILTQYIFSSQDIGFYIILSVAGMTGLTTAILQTAIIGFCNYLPVNYIQVSIAGQSIAGIAAGILRIIINLIEKYTIIDSKTNGMIYFGIGGLFDIICAFSFLYAIRSAFVKLHLAEYFWTRKYRGIKDKDQLTESNQDLLKRTDTQTILRKMVDDSVPTPRAKDFEAINKNIKHSEPQIIGKKQKKKKRKRNIKEKKLASSLEKQQNTYLRFRTKSVTSQSSDDSESNMTTDDDDEFEQERVEITSSTTTQGSINNTTNVHSSNKLMIPVLPEEIMSIDADQFNEDQGIQTQNIEQQDYDDEDNNNDDDGDNNGKPEKVTYLGVMKKIKWVAFALFLVFFVTFLPFPAMLTSLKSQYKWVNDESWMPVFLVLEFNICDYIGRQFIAACTTCSFSKRTLWIGCVWRILLYPLFIALHKEVIKNDIVAYAATALLGLTNGHFCCLCFIWAPSMVNSNEQQLCGAIMSFALVIGITAGSNFTLLLDTLHVI